MALYSPLFMRWKMNPVKIGLHLGYSLRLQEEFVGVVVRVEGLRGKMAESSRGVEELFESLLAEAFA